MDRLSDTNGHSRTEPVSRWWNIALVLATAGFIGVTLGLFPALLALAGEARGFDISANGMLAAMPAAAGILVGPFVPRLIRVLGPLRLFIWSSSLAAGAALLFPIFSEPWAWFLVRFGMGAAMGIQWVVSETWMNRVATGPRRGKILSVYVIILSAAIALGPYLLSIIGTQGQFPFLAAAVLLVLSILPLAFAGNGLGSEPHREAALSLRDAIRRKPSAMLTGLADGFVFQTLLVFLPLFFMRQNLPEASALSHLTVFCLGCVLLQFVVGHMLDRFSPALVLMVCCALLIVGLTLVSPVKDTPVLAWPLLVLAGGCAAAIYTAGLAGINDAFSAAEMPSGTAAFSILWYVGGLSGPAAAGYAMDLWGPSGMVVVVGAACAAVIGMSAAILLGSRISEQQKGT